MTDNDNSPYVVDDKTIDEFYYRISGQTHRSFLWRWLIKTKWFFQEKDFSLPTKTPKVRNFLLIDLQGIRYSIRQFSTARYLLRYVDSDGNVFVNAFNIYSGYHSIEITEIPGKIPTFTQSTKGPMTVRSAKRVGVKYKLFGLKRLRTWRLRYPEIF